MSSAPSFSIVIPTFQRRETVCDAVRALCAARYDGAVDLTVVVDGSTDGTAEALSRIDCPYPIKIIEQPNSGAAAARERGAAGTSGEIILFLDDDMIADPDILEQHVRSYASGADAVLGHIPLDRDSPQSFLAAAAGRWARDRAERLTRDGSVSAFDVLTGHLSIRRSVFEEIGGFDPQFTHSGSYGNEDLDLGARLLERHKVIFNPLAVASQRYIVTPRQYLQQWREAGAADVLFARKHPVLAEKVFEQHGAGLSAARLLHRPVAALSFLGRAVCNSALWLAEREERTPAALRRLLSLLFRHARDIAYWTGVRQAGGVPRGSSVLILCYHAIADLSADPVLAEYGIARHVFVGHLDDLQARGFAFIGPDELVGMLDGKAAPPRKAVLLTFDDCYEDLVEIARDVLDPRGIRAIAFAVTGMPSGTNEWDQRIGAGRLRILAADGLQDLQRHGVEIGCHSRSHRPLQSTDEPWLASETAGAADDLVRLGLPRPRFFAYPHAVYDDRSRNAARAARFEAAFGAEPRRVAATSDRYALPRVMMFAQDSGWRFRLKTSAPALSALTRMNVVLRRNAARIPRFLRRFRRPDEAGGAGGAAGATGGSGVRQPDAPAPTGQARSLALGAPLGQRDVPGGKRRASRGTRA